MKTYIIILFMGFWVANSYAQSPQKISYVYDDLSRLSEVNYPNGTKIVYTYDALGNRQTQVITNGTCTPPAAPTVNSVNITSGQTATLTATCPTGGIVRWYDVPTGGNVIYSQPNQNTFTTPPLTATTTYYATCTPVGCESSRGSGTVTVATSSPCPTTLTHSGSILGTTYTASQNIISTANVASSTGYIAEKYIQLNPGFQAGPNEVFRAEIGGCMPTSGLIAYYPFNGNANDESGNTTNGINNGGTFVNDRAGNPSKAIQFNGSSWVDIGTTLQNNPFTINFWVYVPALPSSGNNYALISKLDNNSPHLYKNHEIYLQSNGKVNIIIAGGTIWNNFTSIGTLTTNNWKMLTLSYNGSTASFYINGVLDASLSVNYSISNVKTVFGRRAGPFNSTDNIYFNGRLDDIRFYNRALTDQEVQSIYLIER